MRKSVRWLLCVGVVLGSLAATPAEACYRCQWALVCVVDECYLQEFCNYQGCCGVSWEDCDAPPTVPTCMESGDFCRWADSDNLNFERTNRDDSALLDSASSCS